MIICFADLETSGLSPLRHKILEFAYIIYDDDKDEILESNTAYINHKELLITRDAYNINKISLEDIFNSEVYESDLINHIQNLIRKYNIDAFAGYNIYSFDIKFIIQLFKNYDLEFKTNKIIDVYLIIKGKYPSKNNKLESVCNYLKIPIEAHKGSSDIKATLEIYRKLRGR